MALLINLSNSCCVVFYSTLPIIKMRSNTLLTVLLISVLACGALSRDLFVVRSSSEEGNGISLAEQLTANGYVIVYVIVFVTCGCLVVVLWFLLCAQ